MKRSSGIIMPLFSLPSPYGIGTMGKAAYDFVDFLRESGQTYWQLLPLGPTDLGNSPYSSPSTFAGNPFFIDIDILISDGLLKKSDINKINWGEEENKVDYDKIKNNRFIVLRTAYNNSKGKFNTEIDEFVKQNSNWVINYALFMAIKNEFDGKPWTQWPDDIKKRNVEAIEKYKVELSSEIDFWIFTQFLFYKQWNDLRDYARKQGIRFIGDIPIYVAMDSADLWSEPWFFQLDDEYNPTAVAGCPPDAFQADGQLWGNPLYDYDKMKADGYGWWIRRIEGASKLYDVVRIDHFRGFESYWSVPYGEKTAVNGEWKKGPGMSLVGVLTSWFSDMVFIAEDLGIITDEVRQLLCDSKLPGMKVLLFAFDSKNVSSYLPHCCKYNSCCYVGTHDNDTVLGWLDKAPKEDVEFAKDYMHITEDEGWCFGFIRTGMATVCDLFMVQMQDILELPTSARTNFPGIASGYWNWRTTSKAITKDLSKRLYKLTKVFNRLTY